uniref:C-type lectin domain-containing protein n=1 Tax=Neolamprologus brichardi TaxID=32507 RepID=A0A3Q4HVJ3_NEOBR
MGVLTSLLFYTLLGSLIFYFIYLLIFPVFSGQRSFYLVIILCLSLLSVFLITGYLLVWIVSCLMFLPEKTCPTGWEMFSGVCYFLSGTSANWDEARRDCRDKGADLVLIESSKEQTFLSAITNENTWIGLNDKEQEGTWKWVDGTPLNLTYWAEAQPDDGGGKEDCVHVRNDEKKSWNDLSCSTSLKWICEKTPNHCTVS